MNRLKVLFFPLFLMLATSAHAGLDEVVIKDIISGGTGCPDGTFRALLSEDKTEASILFDAYYADTSERGSDFVRASCNIGLSLFVPPGLSASLVTMDYRGFVSVPDGGSAGLNAQYFFAGQRLSSTLREVWTMTEFGGEEFLISDTLLGVAYSQCGDSVIARANTSILARRGFEDSETFIQVDSLDAEAALIYNFQWRTCTPPEEPFRT